MKELSRRDFLKLLNTEKVKLVELENRYVSPFFCHSYFIDTFKYKDFYWETKCQECEWRMKDDLENLKIKILEVVKEGGY